ncbi:MAG: outer membrane protein assembly factor BamA, partial [Alloprevotella sp.]
MKYLHPSLLFMVCALFALTSAAQTKVKPEIIYSTQPQKYVLGGVAIDGIKGYDDDLLLNIAGLEVGSTYEVPGEGISQAIRNYWKQGLFSNVEIDADS